MTDPEALLEAHRASVGEESARKMEAGREKYGDAWLDEDPEYLLRRMEEEFMEFRQAVEHDKDVDAAIEEMGDIENFGLMYLVRAQMEDTDV